MGFLPSPDTDLTNLCLEELEALQRLLQSELALSKARQSHIEALLKKVAGSISACK